MKIVILLLTILTLSCTKRQDHITLTGTANTCGGIFYYSLHCDNAKISGIIHTKSKVNNVSLIVYYAGKSARVNAIFKPPFNLGYYEFSIPVLPNEHLNSVMFLGCSD